ncbi:hypothetical protein FRC04_008030 [Tulasnella sp. 424]|nr:hypothetical protein FRC04_008030 [Tulasnella sp. 424]KAG8959350.1 hypothetical protein FRC05_007898 [Tulasnella sp. 425]
MVSTVYLPSSLPGYSLAASPHSPMSDFFDSGDEPAFPAPPYSLPPSPAPSYNGEINPTATHKQENPPSNAEAENLENQLDGLWAVVEMMEDRVQSAIATSSSIHFLYYRTERICINIARWTGLVAGLGEAMEPLEETLAVLKRERTAANRSKVAARKDSAAALKDVRRVQKALAQMAD